MIRHVSVLTFAEGVTDAQVQQLADAISVLPQRLAIRRYQFGRDLGLSEGNASFGIVADFDSVDDYRAYRDDPEHGRIIAEILRPLITARTVMQYEIEE